MDDGTYIILSFADETLAIDCPGASDADRKNVCVKTKDGSDGQFIRLTTNDDGSRRLIFALSGKCLDIAGGDLVSGSNVQQYHDNATRAQAWTIMDDGTTEVDGTTCTAAVIANADASDLVMTADSKLSGANVCITTTAGTDNQRWVFMPAPPVMDGTYCIRSVLDTNAVMDVSGGSLADRANIQLYGANGTNAQIWRVINQSDGLCKIKNIQSGKCLNVANNDPADRTNVQQYKDDGTDANLWLLEPMGSMLINGATVPTYRIHFKTGAGKVIDAAGGETTPKTNVQIYHTNGTSAQLWAFEPYAAAVSELPAPADIQVSASEGGNDGLRVYGNTITAVYPSWLCSGTEYQCRYRIRTRKPGKVIGDWGSWQSIDDGSLSNDGWGIIGEANCVTANTARKYSPYGIAIVPMTGIDYEEIQIEVRRYEPDYEGFAVTANAHGSSAGAVVRVVWHPSLSITSALLSPSGIDITYVSDYQMDGNTLAIDSVVIGGMTVLKDFRATGMPYAGVINIPLDSLSGIPFENDTAAIIASIETDSGTAEGAYSLPVTYASGMTLAVSPSITDRDDATVAVSYTPTGNDHLFVIYEDRMERADRDIIIPPLGKDFDIVLIQSSEDGSWGMLRTAHNAMRVNGFIWNYDGQCTMLLHGLGSSPSAAIEITADSEETVTTGRQRPVYHFGAGKKVKRDASGIYSDLSKHTTRSAFENLSGAGIATFRTPDGDICRVAILSVKLSESGIKNDELGTWGSVAVEQEEADE